LSWPGGTLSNRFWVPNAVHELSASLSRVARPRAGALVSASPDQLGCFCIVQRFLTKSPVTCGALPCWNPDSPVADHASPFLHIKCNAPPEASMALFRDKRNRSISAACTDPVGKCSCAERRAKDEKWELCKKGQDFSAILV